MKKRFLVMAVCVSACMPVSALGAEIAGPVISGTAQENNDNKEETVSEEAVEKKESGKIEDSSGRYRCIRLSWQKRGVCDR